MLEDLKNIFRGDKFYTKIILINVIVFLVVELVGQFSAPFYQFVTDWFYLPADLGKLITRPWTIITYMFLHAGLRHIFYNMIILYWFARIFQDFMGSQRLLGVYFLGGISGGILFLLFYNLGFLAGEVSTVYMEKLALVGASAGVMAVVIAAGFRFQDYEMNLFLIGPVKLKYVALGLFVITTLLNFTSNLGGNLAHIGGALLGYLYIKQLDKGQDWAFAFSEKVKGLGSLLEKKPKLRVVPNDHAKGKKTANTKAGINGSEMQAKTDAILDKISKSGYDNLTKEEKEFLFKLSKNK